MQIAAIISISPSSAIPQQSSGKILKHVAAKPAPSGAAPWAGCCMHKGGQRLITADVRNKAGRLNGHREVPSEAVIALHLSVQKKEFENTENSAELDMIRASRPISLGTWAESDTQGDAKYSWSIWGAFHKEGP